MHIIIIYGIGFLWSRQLSVISISTISPTKHKGKILESVDILDYNEITIILQIENSNEIIKTDIVGIQLEN